MSFVKINGRNILSENDIDFNFLKLIQLYVMTYGRAYSKYGKAIISSNKIYKLIQTAKKSDDIDLKKSAEIIYDKMLHHHQHAAEFTFSDKVYPDGMYYVYVWYLAGEGVYVTFDSAVKIFEDENLTPGGVKFKSDNWDEIYNLFTFLPSGHFKEKLYNSLYKPLNGIGIDENSVIKLKCSLEIDINYGGRYGK